MTKAEFATLMAAIFHAYPAHKGQDTPSFHALWWKFLQEAEYQSAASALAEYIRTNPYPPSISDILKGSSITKEKREVESLIAEKIRLQRQRFMARLERGAS